MTRQTQDASKLESYFSREYAAGVATHPWRERGRNAATLLVRPMERKRARRLTEIDASRLKLHLGCGDTYLDNWVNIDLARPGRKLDLKWDLRVGLPFPDRSVVAVFSEHLFEHIPLPGAVVLLKECRRVLSPGGVIRIGVPDFERYIRAYSGADPIIDDVRPDRPTRGIAISEPFFFHGHRAMYDAETLCLLLHESGFVEAERSESGTSLIGPVPDSPGRRPETLYIEAIAP